MADENKVDTPVKDNESTQEADSKVESKVLAELDAKIAKLQKMFDDNRAFVWKQADLIGELSKKVKTEKTTEEVVEVAKEVSEKFDYHKLTPSEKDAIKVYMKEHISKLPDEAKKEVRQELEDTDKFQIFAKEIHDKIRRKPSFVSDIFDEKKIDPVSDQKASDIRKLFKLADDEKNSTPPAGGASRGTPIPDAKRDAPKRKYPSGGVLSLLN